MKPTLPSLESFLPALTDYVTRLAQEVAAGQIATWEKFTARVHDFYKPEIMQQIEAIIPGWNQMAACANGATLIHVTAALVALKLLPEYQRAAKKEKILFEWIVLLHDLAKQIQPGTRDHLHGFHSALCAGRILPGLGFPVTGAYDAQFDAWAALTNAARRAQTDGETYIQDQRQLPAILAGIATLFGRNTSTALIVTAILLHYSIDTVSDWPQAAPLSDEEIQLYFDPNWIPYLKMIMLVDSDAYALFDPVLRATMRQETLQAFDKVQLLIA